MMKTQKQTGFTLIELVAVMGVLSVIMGIAITLLFQMFDLQMRSEENSDRTRSTNRFVASFRQDIQTYGKPELKTGSIASGEKPLRWTLNGKTLEYELLSGKHPGQRFVRRIEKTGEKMNRSEDYALPDGTALSTFEGKDKNAGLVALLLWRQMPVGEAPKPNELNPFEQNGAEYAGVWRTVFARFRTENKTEGKP
jgi:prepilin-type N-terminal cleavage/methylation domain-containing protein